MDSKIKYMWELMHGDGDHYEKQNLILDNENEINFFDYVISLEFKSEDCEGLDNISEDEKLKLYQLLEKTKWHRDYMTFENYFDKSYLTDILRNLGYIQNDITCDGWHYANVEYVKRKEVKPKTIKK